MRVYFGTYDRAAFEAKKLLMKYGIQALVMIDPKKKQWVIDYTDIESTEEARQRTKDKNKVPIV